MFRTSRSQSLFIAGIIFAGVCGFVAAPVSAYAERISELAVLEGCWAVDAEENNTLGEVFNQTGTVRVVADPADHAVAFDYDYRVTEATGVYASISTIRQMRERLIFDAAAGMIAVESYGPGATEPGVSNAALSADGRQVFRTFMFHHPRRDITLFGEDLMTIRSQTEIRRTNEIRDVFGAYRETYVEEWRRIGHDPAGCSEPASD